MIQQRFSEGISSRSGDVGVLVTIKLERFPIRICELLIKSNPREDFVEILSRVLPTGSYAEFERWKQHRRRSTANLFRLSCLDHLLTNTAQREEPQSGSATTVKGGFRLEFSVLADHMLAHIVFHSPTDGFLLGHCLFCINDGALRDVSCSCVF